MDKVKITIRPATLTDKDFILSSWLQNQYYSSPDYFQLIPKDIYFAAYSCVIKTILLTPGVQINVATDVTDPLWIGGFCVFKGGGDIYWIYVRKDFRDQGIARLLLPDTTIKTARVLTNARALTKTGQSLVKKMGLLVSPFEGESDGKRSESI